MIAGNQKQESSGKWITSEVLPSIRKNGGYLSPTVDFSDFDTMQKLFTAWRSDREKLVAAEGKNKPTYSQQYNLQHDRNC